MNEPILDLECNGHRITMDRRDTYLRVNCNGVTNAQFNEMNLGKIEALRHALNFAAYLEANALKYPKT